jgi:ferredoxin
MPSAAPFAPRPPGAALALVLLLLTGTAGEAEGQRIARIPESLLREVMPEADRFDQVSGDPPVVRGYRAGPDGTEALLGWVFLTSDLPPEQYGYSGPIEALVGLRPDGSLTGVRVTDYMESYMRTMGDFLHTPGFQEQFAGKRVGDPFRLWDDVEGISRVSISVRALSRGVRDSARRVAAAYGVASEFASTTGIVDPVGRSWYELRQLGVVQRFEVTEPGQGSAGIALAYIESERLGEYFFGPQLYERALRSAERRGGAEDLFLYAIDGSRLRLFRQQGWSVVQGADTVPIDPANVVSLGLPSGGVVAGEATMVGLILLDGSVDAARPLTFVYDLGDLGIHTVEYLSQEARVALAEAAEPTEPSSERASLPSEGSVVEVDERPEVDVPAGAQAEGSPSADLELPMPEARAELETEAGGVAEAVAAPEPGVGAAREAGVEAVPSADGPGPELALDFVLTEDESLLERTLSGTSWLRVGLMVVVLALGTAAFLTKSSGLRWVSLTVTLLVLGFYDGGFLSVSHITSGIWAGVGVYARDLPLLLFVVFTLATTLVWGRVFCGFLCPFGALQDFIDRVVPKSWKRSLTPKAHDRAVRVKYGVLAVVVAPALAGSQVSLYQYVEPFGTVFFLSPSILLWSIALAFLIASVFIPRFYCRYACPFGAALALLSFVSLRRIPRVEQCSLCAVCEQKCPTGAIRREKIDFPECVRCNICEVQLSERSGVCRHDMADVRARLVQIGEVSRV